jgi:hypothetical protein
MVADLADVATVGLDTWEARGFAGFDGSTVETLGDRHAPMGDTFYLLECKYD